MFIRIWRTRCNEYQLARVYLVRWKSIALVRHIKAISNHDLVSWLRSLTVGGVSQRLTNHHHIFDRSPKIVICLERSVLIEKTRSRRVLLVFPFIICIRGDRGRWKKKDNNVVYSTSIFDFVSLFSRRASVYVPRRVHDVHIIYERIRIYVNVREVRRIFSVFNRGQR